MLTSQHSQVSIVPGIGRREEFEQFDGTYEPTIGLKAVAKILNCSAEQCRRLAEAKKIPVFRIGYRWKSTASAIWDAIEHLPRSSREVILLSDVEDFAYREIAEILGVPIGTVMSRLARARKAVRRALEATQVGICRRRVPNNRNRCVSGATRMIANG